MRRRRREAAILRNCRKGVDPSEYNEIIEGENYTSSELQRLPVAQRIAILRSRTGENQQIQKDREKAEKADNAKAAPVAPLTRADIERLRQQREIQ